MTNQTGPIQFSINTIEFTLSNPEQTGRALKELARLPLGHVLARIKQETSCDEYHDIVGDEQLIHVTPKDRFICVLLRHLPVAVIINRKPYRFEDRHQTGLSLKERAGIPSSDVLFLNRPHEDEVIPNDARITLHEGEKFYSSPPANYGNEVADDLDVGYADYELISQPGDWAWLLISNYPLPDGYIPAQVKLLIKLPPGFPDAAPDMFWVFPHIRTAVGSVPQGTSLLDHMGQSWQQFSWHLQPGAWLPGISTLRDYLRCVRTRLEKRN